MTRITDIRGGLNLKAQGHQADLGGCSSHHLPTTWGGAYSGGSTIGHTACFCQSWRKISGKLRRQKGGRVFARN